MTTTNAIKKLTKAGFEVSQTRNAFTATSPTKRHLITFYKNGGEDQVVCINVRRPNDISDSQSDYSAGVFADTITQAIALA